MNKTQQRRSRCRRTAWAGMMVLICAASAQADTGTWTANSGGNWSDSTKWDSNIVADGATYDAKFIADITAGRTITLDSARTIGNLYFQDIVASNGWTLGGSNTLTFNADGAGGGTSILDVASGTSLSVGSGVVFAGSSSINKTGTGSLSLNNSNATHAFTGGLTVSAGSLSINTPDALKYVAITLGGGSDNVSVGFSNNVTTNTGHITVAGPGTGSVTLNWGILNSNNLNAGITLDKTVRVNVTSGLLEFGQQVTGSGGIYKTGSSALRLSNYSNNFSGPVTVSQGELQVWVNNGALPNGTVTLGDASTGSANVSFATGVSTLGSGKNLHFTNNGTGSASIGTLNGANNAVNIAGTVTLDRSISIGTSYASSLTLSGKITGVGGVTVNTSTSNPVVFSGTNHDYTGFTKVNNGTLKLSGSSTNNIYASSSITIGSNGKLDVTGLTGGTIVLANGQTLGGSGSITGGVNIASGSILSPGNSPGTLVINNGNATWASGGVYQWQLLDDSLTAGTGWDLLNLTGSGTIIVTATSVNPFNIVLQTLSDATTPGSALNFDGNVAHQWLIASSANALTGWDVADGTASELFAVNAAGFADAHAGSQFFVSKIGNDVYLNYTVPEPATVALIALGVIAVAGRRREQSN